MGHFIRLRSPDGHGFKAWLAEPRGTPRGGLVVGMEMYGVNGYLTGVCDSYAAEGYLAIAPALFERFEPDLTLPYDEAGSRRGKDLSAIVDHDRTMVDIETAAARVRGAGADGESGKVAIMGFCFGGTVTWLAACRGNFDAAIAYYGSDMCDYPDETARCPVICHVGDRDTAVPPADVAAFRQSQPGVHWYVYPDVPHGFDNSTRPARHRAEAAALAGQRSVEFLRRHIG